MALLLAVPLSLSACQRGESSTGGETRPVVRAADATASPSPTLPAEVAAFAERRVQCDHFRGEEAYDAERAHFLAVRLAQLCTGTDAALAALKKRYATDEAAIAALAQFEDKIE